MKIAVPTMNGEVFQHFGQTKEFTVFTVNDDTHEIVDEVSISSTPHAGHGNGQHGEGHGPGGCASQAFGTLMSMGVNVLIAGGMGAGAVNGLMRCGIQACRGASGDAKQAVLEFVKGNLSDSGEVCRDHGKHHN